MTGGKKDTQQQLARLADSLVEDILSVSDEDILAEAAEDYGDAEAAAEHVRGLIHQAVLESSKSRLAAAREAYQKGRERARPNVLNLPYAEKRAIVDGFVASDSQLKAKLTLAARKGQQLSERDLDSMLDALLELGVIDEEGKPV